MGWIAWYTPFSGRVRDSERAWLEATKNSVRASSLLPLRFHFVLGIFTGNLGIIFEFFISYSTLFSLSLSAYRRNAHAGTGRGSVDNCWQWLHLFRLPNILQINIAHIWLLALIVPGQGPIWSMYLSQLFLIDHMYVMSLSLPQCVECTNCTAFSILQRKYHIDFPAKIIANS